MDCINNDTYYYYYTPDIKGWALFGPLFGYKSDNPDTMDSIKSSVPLLTAYPARDANAWGTHRNGMDGMLGGIRSLQG